MGATSQIQWTDATWNIARGCTKVDDDCKFCYMYRDSFDGTRYNPLQVIKTKTVFRLPLKIEQPSKIFTSSLTDVFHKDIDSYRHEMWDIIRACPHHTFQILTKRPERIRQCLPLDWGMGYKNVWIGTSVGSPDSEHRIEKLCEVDAEVRFISFEPLWQKVNFIMPVDYSDGSTLINWVIVGGESGNNTGKYRYRPCEVDWIKEIVWECQDHRVPVFVKQLGTHLAKQYCLKDRHGGDMWEWSHNELHALKIRQFPPIHSFNHSPIQH